MTRSAIPLRVTIRKVFDADRAADGGRALNQCEAVNEIETIVNRLYGEIAPRESGSSFVTVLKEWSCPMGKPMSYAVKLRRHVHAMWGVSLAWDWPSPDPENHKSESLEVEDDYHLVSIMNLYATMRASNIGDNPMSLTWLLNRVASFAVEDPDPIVSTWNFLADMDTTKDEDRQFAIERFHRLLERMRRDRVSFKMIQQRLASRSYLQLVKVMAGNDQFEQSPIYIEMRDLMLGAFGLELRVAEPEQSE